MRRAWTVVRMQSVNLPLQVGMPWLVLGLAFLVNLAIFAMIADDGPHTTGGLMSIYIVVLISHLQTMTQVFPFALGLSVTRRDFFAGTALLIMIQSALQGLVLTLLLALERATGGWGLDLSFFGVPFLTTGNWFTQWLAYTVPFLFLSFASVFIGTIYKRWNQLGVWVLAIAGALLLGGGAVLLTWLGAWPVVGRFFSETPLLMLLAGYPALLALLAAGAGFLALRRATP